MKDRILQVRKENEMTQNAFAEKLKLSKNFVWMLENGERIPSDRTISDICREFGINEKWLRTGKGEIKIEDQQEERYAMNIAKLQRSDNDTIIRWVNTIAETNPAILRDIESFMKKLLDIDTEEKER